MVGFPFVILDLIVAWIDRKVNTQEADSPNSARVVQGMMVFPVKTGDVISQSGSESSRSAKFIPGEWV